MKQDIRYTQDDALHTDSLPPASSRRSRIKTPCDTSGMDENKELVKQLLEGMPPETRFRIQRFIRLVAERDEYTLKIIRQIEAGRVSPTDALDACLESRP